jgi:NADPH:quinone reductase-like Zn-dependent oxidoreductase
MLRNSAYHIHGYGGPEVLQFDEVPVPVAGPGGVIVAVKAAGVNQLDWKVREGYVRDNFSLTLPAALGVELAGVVTQTGEGASRFVPGDRVMGILHGLGAYARRVAVAEATLARIPESLTDVDAAALPIPSLTAWQALHAAGEPRPGLTVLIHGAAGAVGGFAVQFAKAAGARVLATASATSRDHVSGLRSDSAPRRRGPELTHSSLIDNDGSWLAAGDSRDHRLLPPVQASGVEVRSDSRYPGGVSSMGRLKGKIALITGGTSGMGAATAKLFKAEGATVIVTGSNPETLEAARRDLDDIEVIASDAGDPAAARSLVDEVKGRHGRIDVLFVNAGVAKTAPVDRVDEVFFDSQFNVNVRGPYFLIQHAAPGDTRRSLDHSYLVNRPREGDGRPVRLFGDQGRLAILRPLLRRRTGPAGYPRQRDQPRPDRDADLGEDGRDGREIGCNAGAYRQHHPAETCRQAGGDRGRRPLPRLRRVFLHHRY